MLRVDQARFQAEQYGAWTAVEGSSIAPAPSSNYYEPFTPACYPHVEYLIYDPTSEAHRVSSEHDVGIGHSSPYASSATADTALPIHAPVPISAYSTLLPSIHQSPRSPTPQPLMETAALPKAEPTYAHATAADEDVKPFNPIALYVDMPQKTFPTPCELLSELTARDQLADTALPYPLRSATDHANHPQDFACGSSGRVSPLSPAAEAFTLDADAASKASRRGRVHPVKKPETQRKAHFRAIAENIGFKPTDPYVVPPIFCCTKTHNSPLICPINALKFLHYTRACAHSMIGFDHLFGAPPGVGILLFRDTITSHDKKRHYLECIEQYVLWLHEQIRLVGTDAVQFERVPEYRGLTSRSIRVSAPSFFLLRSLTSWIFEISRRCWSTCRTNAEHCVLRC